MPNTIIPKRSTVASKVPTTSDLALGEIAINHADRLLYARHPVSGTVQSIGGSGGAQADWSATSGPAQILNKPTLGTAAAANSSDFATASQGTKADNAVANGGGASTLRVLTQAAYNAISSPDSATVYVITA